MSDHCYLHLFYSYTINLIEYSNNQCDFKIFRLNLHKNLRVRLFSHSKDGIVMSIVVLCDFTDNFTVFKEKSHCI